MLPPGWREDCGAFIFRFSDVTTTSVPFGKWKARTKAQAHNNLPPLHFLPTLLHPPPHRNTVSDTIDTILIFEKQI